MNIKKCNKCNLEKKISVEYFRQCKYSSGNLYFKSICKDCEKSYAKEYSKNYVKTEDQKKRFLNYKRKWNVINKEKNKQKYRDKIKNNINFKLRKNVSRAISHAIKKNNNSFIKYLTYSIEELKNHLKNQFNSNMSWDNYGIYWHIDHIIPQSCLPYISMKDNNFKKCWALNNLRPLEAKQNMLDGSTRVRHRTFIGEI